MFNFTTTTIVNSASADLFKEVDDVLYVKNVGSFKKGEVISVVPKAYAKEEVDTATVTAPTAVAGAIYRLTVDIELYKSESSLYARPWPTKGKAIYAEAIADSTDAKALAAKLAKNLGEYMNLVYDKDILVVSNASGTAAITIKGVEGTQKIKSVVLEKWEDATDPSSVYAGGKWIVAATGTVDGKADPGFGTYKHLVHNVVLPTYENMRYGNAVANAPKLDGEYTQYIVTKRVERDPYGTGAVGQVLVSETQHVFWVEKAAADFGTALTNLMATSTSLLDE